MKIIDSIYGEFEIEKILEELVNTKEIQRLKGIHQGGASYLVNEKWNVTRYEHSVGVMLLIRLVGGSIEEQISGLLHDISHTAFSHVVDFALKNKEDYNEMIYDDIIENSNIPSILENYGYDYKKLTRAENWSILERDLPKLCADRVDYTLRDMYHYMNISKEEISIFLNDLTVINGELVLKSLKTAEWFVDIFYKVVIDFFLNPLNVYGYDKLSKAIKLSLDLEEITLDDLLKSDEELYIKLKKSSSKEVLQLLRELKEKVILTENKEDYDIFQKGKIRFIDPTVIENYEIFNASQRSESIKLLTEKALEKVNEGVYIKIN